MNSCGSSADVDPLEPDEHADPVVDVHDEIADLQIAEIREERARRRLAPASAPWRSSSKTSVSAQSCRPASGSRKPLDRWPMATSTAAVVRVLAALDRRGRHVVVRQHLDRALGASLRVGDEHDGFAPLTRRAAARRPSRARVRRTRSPAASRCGGLGLRPIGERLERRGALERAARSRPSPRRGPRAPAGARSCRTNRILVAGRQSARDASGTRREPRPARRRARGPERTRVVDERGRPVGRVTSRRPSAVPEAERRAPGRARRSNAA